MKNDPHKAVLFQLIQYLAHSQEEAATKAFEWLEIVRDAARRNHDDEFADAAEEAIRHMATQQTRRQMDRLSGADDS